MAPRSFTATVPSFVQTTFFKDLANDPAQAESLLDPGWLLLASAQDQRGLPSAESRVQGIAKTVDCFRNLCAASKNLSLNPPEDTQGCLLTAALHYVESTIKEGHALFKSSSGVSGLLHINSHRQLTSL